MNPHDITNLLLLESLSYSLLQGRPLYHGLTGSELTSEGLHTLLPLPATITTVLNPRRHAPSASLASMWHVVIFAVLRMLRFFSVDEDRFYFTQWLEERLQDKPSRDDGALAAFLREREPQHSLQHKTESSKEFVSVSLAIPNTMWNTLHVQKLFFQQQKEKEDRSTAVVWCVKQVSEADRPHLPLLFPYQNISKTKTEKKDKTTSTSRFVFLLCQRVVPEGIRALLPPHVIVIDRLGMAAMRHITSAIPFYLFEGLQDVWRSNEAIKNKIEIHPFMVRWQIQKKKEKVSILFFPNTEKRNENNFSEKIAGQAIVPTRRMEDTTYARVYTFFITYCFCVLQSTTKEENTNLIGQLEHFLYSQDFLQILLTCVREG